MYRSLFTTIVLLCASISAPAHHLWIDTSPRGIVGQEQEIRVYFGEYTYGLFEKVDGEAFGKVKEFRLWLIDVKGEKTELSFSHKQDFFLANFTPGQEGTYLVILDNDNIDVIDYTQYDFGIFKTHYHSVARVQVGDKVNSTGIYNPSGITLKNLSEKENEVRLQVYYLNEILADHEVNVFITDQWSKQLYTDEEGIVSFNLPWTDTQYIVEITKKEEVPGTFRGKSYEFVWHCVTHYLAL